MMTKMFSGVVVVFIVIILALIVAVYEQRQTIYVSPSTGMRINPAAGESWGFWGGAWAAEGQITDNTLFVSGSATASDDPDKVTIVFSVETQDDSALVCQQENAEKTAAVRAALVGKGIPADSIQTTSYSLGQVREWDSTARKYVYKGFKTTHSMQVELSDISRAGEIIDTSVSAGANNINSVYFGLSDAKMHALRMEALKAAAENAGERGDSIADGLGVTIKRVMSASEGYTYTPVWRDYELAAAPEAAGAQATTEITPGDIKVTATVSVIFEID